MALEVEILYSDYLYITDPLISFITGRKKLLLYTMTWDRLAKVRKTIRIRIVHRNILAKVLFRISVIFHNGLFFQHFCDHLYFMKNESGKICLIRYMYMVYQTFKMAKNDLPNKKHNWFASFNKTYSVKKNTGYMMASLIVNYLKKNCR